MLPGYSGGITWTLTTAGWCTTTTIMTLITLYFVIFALISILPLTLRSLSGPGSGLPGGVVLPGWSQRSVPRGRGLAGDRPVTHSRLLGRWASCGRTNPICCAACHRGLVCLPNINKWSNVIISSLTLFYKIYVFFIHMWTANPWTRIKHLATLLQ